MTKDITGQKYGRLTALKRVENDAHKHAQWLCKCDCGNEVVVLKNSLTSGRTRSCGCYYKDTRHKTHHIHGQSYTRLFSIWANMLQRCECQSNRAYKNYGQRGIRVCEEWHTFATFKEWAESNGYQDTLSIDRIDNNGDYAPSNCQWADAIVQANNTRRNHYLTLNGKTQSLARWSRELNLSESTIYYRLARGATDEEALSLQDRRKR